MTVKHGTESRGRKIAWPAITAILSALLLMFVATTAWGAFFDTAGQSARPMGMGEVFLATRGDVSGYWYNPAGLTAVEHRSVGLTYGILAPSIASDLMRTNITFVTPLGPGGLGLGVSGFSADGATDFVIGGAYGFSLSENLVIGANVKVMRWAIVGEYDPYSNRDDEDISKVAISIDASAAYSFGKPMGLDDLSAGVYAKDANMPNISESGSGDDGKLPIEAGIGLMVKKGGVTGELDAAMVNSQTIFRGGVETGLSGTDFLFRGGIRYGSDFEDDVEQTDFTFGVGYVFNSLVFDYAYNLPLALSESGGRHFVSFGVSF